MPAVPPARRGARFAYLLSLFVFAVAFCVAVAACGGPEAAPEEEPESDVPVEQRRPEGPWRLRTGVQPAPERRVLEPELEAFLADNLAWTGDGGVRLFVPPQRPHDPSRWVWINPGDVTAGERRGSDVTLVTDRSAAHYSPRDLEFVNDGQTWLVTPDGMHRGNYSGGRHLQMEPERSTALAGIRFAATPAWADAVPGQERQHGHLGYVIWLDTDGDGERDLSLWYTGPVGRNEQMFEYFPVDVLIVPAGRPGDLTPEDVSELANTIGARVVVPVDFEPGDAADEAWMRDLDLRARNVPLWYPVLSR